MKKVVHVIIGLNVGGAELMLKRLVLHSQQKGQFHHEVISLTNLGSIGVDLKAHNIPVHTLGMNSIFSLVKIYFNLRKLLLKLEPDVVQTWMYHADFIGGIVAKKLGVKKIIWGIRTTDVSQGGSKLTVLLRSICAKLSYKIPTEIVCAAHISKDTHIKVGYDASKMHVIPNGFELDKLVATEEDRNRIRKEFNIPRNAIVIGSVGRFNVVKNQKFFVEVAAELVKCYPELIFMLVGRGNTSDNSELMSWLKKKNLTDNFRLLGQRNDIPFCLKAMDIFCLHSKTEGFPNVLAEAILLKKAIVCTSVGDVSKIVDKEDICSSNIKSYSSKINKIITNKVYLKQNYLNSKAIILSEKFSINKCVLSFESMYE